MTGVSLPFTYLSTGNGIYPLAPELLLGEIRKMGVDSVELRTVYGTTKPEDVLRSCEMIRKCGMSFSVHSDVKSAESAVEDVFRPLSLILNGESDFVSVIHPLADGNDVMLASLSNEARKYPKIKIALENSRHIPNADGDCAEFVLDAVRNADCDNVGICFDMGHYFYYSEKHHAPRLPSEEFLKRVIHTHIHATTKELRTHFPLDEYILPLREYVEALGAFDGIWNIELEPERFAGAREPASALLGSIETLLRVTSHR